MQVGVAEAPVEARCRPRRATSGDRRDGSNAAGSCPAAARRSPRCGPDVEVAVLPTHDVAGLEEADRADAGRVLVGRAGHVVRRRGRVREARATVGRRGKRERVVPALLLVLEQLPGADAVARPVLPALVLGVDDGRRRWCRSGCTWWRATPGCRTWTDPSSCPEPIRIGHLCTTLSSAGPVYRRDGVVRVDEDDLAGGVAERSGRLVRDVVARALLGGPVEDGRLRPDRAHGRLAERVGAARRGPRAASPRRSRGRCKGHRAARSAAHPCSLHSAPPPANQTTDQDWTIPRSIAPLSTLAGTCGRDDRSVALSSAPGQAQRAGRGLCRAAHRGEAESGPGPGPAASPRRARTRTVTQDALSGRVHANRADDRHGAGRAHPQDTRRRGRAHEPRHRRRRRASGRP